MYGSLTRMESLNMTTVVTVEHTDGERRELSISFHDGATAFQRCVGAAKARARGLMSEADEVAMVRLLGAAFIQVMENAIPPTERSEAARCANIAKTEVEKGLMMGVKALYAREK